MKTIEYRVSYTGNFTIRGLGLSGNPSTEVVRVQARDLNSGFAKALKQAREPLGNGTRREIGIIEFWQVV